MKRFLVQSTWGRNIYCFLSPFPQWSVHINLLGNAEKPLRLEASRLLPPRGIGSDLILPANVVGGRLHLPQHSSELLIGPSELIKR